jgi:hypothetical protein
VLFVVSSSLTTAVQTNIGIQHKFKSCPGATQRNPERVCNNDVHVERGVCSQDPDELSFDCACNEGFAGPACQSTCPGGWDNICSSHGRCFTTNDTFCVCDDGYTGDACQFTCPGFLAPSNARAKRVCSDAGECKEAHDGQKAECHCKASSGRYGAWCQFEQGKEPIIVDGVPCDECGGNSYCDESQQLCVCNSGFFPVGLACVGATEEYAAAGSLRATLLALFVVALNALFFQ